MSDLMALQDKQEITEICYRYGLVIDGRDWAALAALFTPDADAYYLDMPPCHGYQAIEDTCRAALTPLSATQHLISNVVVRLDGDHAECSCYLQAQHVKTGTAGGDNFIIAGRYKFLGWDLGANFSYSQNVQPSCWCTRLRRTVIWPAYGAGIGEPPVFHGGISAAHTADSRRTPAPPASAERVLAVISFVG